jgi:ribonuclease E
LIKTPESVSLEVIRIIQLLAHRIDVARIVVTVSPDVARLLLNERRGTLHDLEQHSSKALTVLAEGSFNHEQVSYECTDHRGMPLRIEI